MPGLHLWGNNTTFCTPSNLREDMPAEFDGHEIKVIVARSRRRGALTTMCFPPGTAATPTQAGRPRRAVALHYMTGDIARRASGKPCHEAVC